MASQELHLKPAAAKTRINFWKFWLGQTISNAGNAFTNFALPLLVYQMTGSAINLAIVMIMEYIPYLLFGMIIGAWVDRVNRKRLMVAIDILSAAVILSIPVLAHFGLLSVWWIYLVGFLKSTLFIGFDAAIYASVPNLVDSEDLVTANGRIQASHSAGYIAGPLLAGILIAFFPMGSLLVIDSFTFLISAWSLMTIKQSFNPPASADAAAQPKTSIFQDIRVAVRYVIHQPVLRNISLMIALVNFVDITAYAQIVLFAKEVLRSEDAQVGVIFSAAATGVVIFSLLAGRVRKRFAFSKVALGCVMAEGILLMLMATLSSYWATIVIWGIFVGLSHLFSINSKSLRQAIVPNHLLGRVLTLANVLAWSLIPLGTFLGGVVIEQTGSVATVYLIIGLLQFLIPIGFAFTALGRAEQYFQQAQAQRLQEAEPVVEAEPRAELEQPSLSA